MYKAVSYVSTDKTYASELSNKTSLQIFALPTMLGAPRSENRPMLNYALPPADAV
jgi:hypothetical protein